MVVVLDRLTGELSDNTELFDMSLDDDDEAGLITIEGEAAKIAAEPLIAALDSHPAVRRWAVWLRRAGVWRLQVLPGSMHNMVWKGEEGGDSDDEYSRSNASRMDDDDSGSDDVSGSWCCVYLVFVVNVVCCGQCGCRF